MHLLWSWGKNLIFCIIVTLLFSRFYKNMNFFLGKVQVSINSSSKFGYTPNAKVAQKQKSSQYFWLPSITWILTREFLRCHSTWKGCSSILFLNFFNQILHRPWLKGWLLIGREVNNNERIIDGDRRFSDRTLEQRVVVVATTKSPSYVMCDLLLLHSSLC